MKTRGCGYDNSDMKIERLLAINRITYIDMSDIKRSVGQ